MWKKILLFTIASLVMLPALAAKPNDKPDKGNKGGGGVPLNVVFCDTYIFGVCDQPIYKFASDLLGEYVDGKDSVSTGIDKFRFGLNVGFSGPRNFKLDLTTCVDEICPVVPTRGWNVFSISPDGAQYLKMKVGDASKPVNFQLEFFDDDDQEWRIMFNPSECPKDDEGKDLATMATVTKFEDDPDTWVFEAEAVDVACLQLRMGGRKNNTFHGLYNLPFKILATAQQ